MRSSYSVFLSLALLWTTCIQARFNIDHNAKAAYFNFVSDETSQYVFALNAVANGDVYFHMSGPVSHTWLGMGIGHEMKDAFMIIAYPSSNRQDTTISVRIGTGHTEPIPSPDFEIIKVYNDTYAPNANTVTEHGKGTIIAHALCKNCSQWVSGRLDTTSTQQPMIFALGPNKDFGSDSPEASLPRHSMYGQYNIDMTKATNYTGWYGRVPAPNIPQFKYPPDDTAFASANTAPAFNVESMSNPLPGAHGAIMCIAFVIVFPLGAVVMQFLKRALWHAAIQVIGFAAVLAGFGIGVNVARQYNRSRHFNSGHQVVGLIILAGLFLQLGLGLVHHTMYVKTNKPTMFGRIHFFLGPFVMLLGLINAGVGFNFAGNSHLNVPYGIVVAVIAIVFLGIIGCQLFCRSRRKYRPDRLSKVFQEPPQKFANEYGEIEMSQRPTFGEDIPEAYEPTTPYTPVAPYSMNVPYTPTTPYTPVSAYTPVTPRTWRKEEISNWPQAPHKEYD